MSSLHFPKIYLILFLSIFALVFWSISFNTPYMWDDYWLNFVIERNADGSLNYTSRFISSWDDLVTTWLSRREFLMNGRISDCFCSITQRMGGKELFSTINTLAIFINVLGLSKLCFQRISLGTTSIVIMGLLLVCPHIDYTIFWMAGACNYLWGSALMVTFLFCLQKIQSAGKTPLLFIIGGSIAGFLCGLWHEGLAAPLAGGMVAFWLIERIRGRKQPSGYLWLMAFSLAGCAICLSAPALWLRVSGEMLNEEKGLLVQLCISVTIIIWRGGIPLFFFMLFFRKRRKELHSPLGWMTLAFICESIVTCNNGACGGAFYYMAITVLILCLQSTADWWKKRERASSIILVPLIGISCVYEHLRMQEMGEDFRSIFTLPKDHGACVVDWPEEKGEIPWLLYRSLPMMRLDPPYYCLDKMFGHGNFIVVFRKENLGSGFCEAFDALDENKAHAIQWNGRCIIRLPKDWYLTNRKIWVHTPDQGEIQLKEEEWWLSSRLYHYLKGDTLGNYTLDWHDGFRYVILPPSIVEWDAIRLKLSKDHTFASKEKRGYKEITLHHP